MEFTLRYSGTVPHHAKAEAHKIRRVLHGQLADYWSRDLRLKDVDATKIKPFVKSARFRFDVRQQEHGQRVGSKPHDWHGYHEVRGIRFVPLVTRWRYLRCEIAMRIWRYEGDLHTGGLLDHQGDLDGKLKALIDALRMPHEDRELPADVTHDGNVFFCVLEDDRLVTKIGIETRNILGPRPAKADQTKVDVDIELRIYPVHTVGNINYGMLFP
jgi:hypothetical protein